MALSNTAVPKYYGMFRDAVIRREILVCETVSLEMNRIDQLIDNPRYWYDDRAVEGFIHYCENELTLTDGSDLYLLDSFKVWAEQIYGWYYFIERTIKYSDVSKSSSYEAAKEAWNKANNANSKIDNLKIGGRNLIPVGMIKNCNGLSTFSYDKASNTWTCVAPIGSNSLGRGIYFDPGVKKIYIPRGYTYIISLEVNPEVACSWNADVNNGYDGMPSGTGNDNDNTSLRKKSVQSLVANKWQRVWFSYTPKTNVSYDIFDASTNWGIVTTNAKSPIKFKIRNVKGEFGTVPTDWTPAPEDSLESVDVEYYLSTSQTSLSGGSWSTTAPTWVNGKYMWSRTVKTDGAGNKTYSPSQNGVCIAGAKGDTGPRGPQGATGAQGPTGASGKGIKSTAITYQLCASQTTAPTGTWLGSPPKTDIAKPYLWTRTVITYTDNATSTSYSVSSTFDSIMVGGRNLAEATNQGIKNWYWGMRTGGYSRDEIVDNNVRTCKMVRDSVAQSGWSVIGYTDIGRHKWKPNTTYTLSVEVKSNVVTYFYPQFRESDGTDQIIASVNSINATTVINKWAKLIWVVKSVENLPTATAQDTCFTSMDSTPGVWYQFKNLKLEEGNVATAWTPAPEDLETRISAAETEISNNNKQIALKASQTEVTNLKGALGDLSVYTNKKTTMVQDITGWQYTWDTVISTDAAEIASHKDYITFDKGNIILGDSASASKLKLTKDSIQFKGTSDTAIKPDSDATAWITGKVFHINSGEIESGLTFGNTKLEPISDGLSIKRNNRTSNDEYYKTTIGDNITLNTVLGRNVTISRDELCMGTSSLPAAFGDDGEFRVRFGSKSFLGFPYSDRNKEMGKGSVSLVNGGKPYGIQSMTLVGGTTHGTHSIAAMGATVNGSRSAAFGEELLSDYDHQFIIGKCNVSADKAFIIGNGTYDKRSNALTVDWSGNITAPNLTSPGALRLGFNGGDFQPYFTKGNSASFKVWLTGYTTTGMKEVIFFMPFSRPIIGASGVSVSSVNGLIIRQNNKYLYGSTATEYVKPSSYTSEIVDGGQGVNIRAKMPNTTNVTNNTACAITASIKITFS